MPHFPGFRYCGPGTDVAESDRAGGPINKLDECCREHDLALTDPLQSQGSADQAFVECASKEGILGKSFATAVQAKEVLRPILGNLLPGTKDVPTGQEEITPDKRPLLPDNAQPEKNYPERPTKLFRKGLTFDQSAHIPNGPDRDPGGGTMEVVQETPNLPGGGAMGAGQVPPMSVKPMHDGKMIFHSERTFRHYITNPEAFNTTDYKKAWSEGWKIVPYNSIAASVKLRDWEWIQVMAKRWRVLNYGYKLKHAIPFVNGAKTIGNSQVPEIMFNLMPVLEVYKNKGYMLPPTKFTVPNQYMLFNEHVQEKSKLPELTVDIDQFINPYGGPQNRQVWFHCAQATTAVPIFSLMNSKEYDVMNPNEQDSFEHTIPVEDLKWRSNFMPCPNVNNQAYDVANYKGTWDGEIDWTPLATNENNTDWLDSLRRNPRKPPPMCLYRPMQMTDINGANLNICFMVYITYHSTIEIDINDAHALPMFLRTVGPTDGVKELIDVFGSDNTGATGGYLQPMGANFVGLYTGPNSAVSLN